jgi:hypothetical protein
MPNKYNKKPNGKNDTGKPAKYETIEELDSKITEYFETKCKDEYVTDEVGNVMTTKSGTPIVKYNPPTVSGLTLFLGFSDRKALYDYKPKPYYTDTIKKAITFIEAYAEKQLHIGNSVGAIFWLKNHGWIDKKEVDVKDDRAIEAEKQRKIEELLNGIDKK